MSGHPADKAGTSSGLSHQSTRKALRSERAIELLIDAARSRRHTVQYMPEPQRYEVIYAGAPPFTDPRSGEVEATILINRDGSLRTKLGVVDA